MHDSLAMFVVNFWNKKQSLINPLPLSQSRPFLYNSDKEQCSKYFMGISPF